MAEIVPFKSPASKARVAAMAKKALSGLQQIDLDAEAARERKEKQRAALVAKMETAMHDFLRAQDRVAMARGELALAFGEDVARTQYQLAEARLLLEHGIVRIL